MKNFLCLTFTVFIMCFCPVLFGVRVYAATNAGDAQINNANDVKAWYQSHGISCNDNNANYIYQKITDGVNLPSLLFCDASYGYFYKGNYTIDGNSCILYNDGSDDSFYFPSGGNYSGYSLNGNISWASYFSAVSNIDFSNIIYDPLIPTPDLSVTYIDIPSNASAAFPLVVGLNNASEEYYIQFIMENMTPSYIAITPSGNYEVKSYYQFPSHFIAEASDLVGSDTLNSGLLTGMLSAAWRGDISSYVLTDDNFIAKSNDVSGFANSVQFTAYKTAYLLNRDIACFYGNITGLSCRYFVVRDGLVYGGKVKSWTNLYNIGFNESIPDYYIPYEVAQGYENETTTEIVPVETSNPIVNPPANQTGKKTGLNININLGSNVPNYPDYPTIATYNTDNLLVNAIDTARQLPAFFKNTTGLFGDVFNGLLPEEFWNIVLTGFLFSIVIMIIKVL